MTESIYPSLSPGAEIAGYRIESLLGRGGMAVVFRARDLRLDRPVGLKVLAPELSESPGCSVGARLRRALSRCGWGAGPAYGATPPPSRVLAHRFATASGRP